MNPVEESVCVHTSAPRRHLPAMCSRPPSITCCRGQAASWPPVPHTNVRLSPDGPRVWRKGQRKWFGIPGPSAPTCLSSSDSPHSFSRGLCSGSRRWHLFHSVTFLLGPVPKGLVPRSGIQTAESAPGLRRVPRTMWRLSLPNCLSPGRWARGSCLVQIWAGWESFVQTRNPGVWNLAQSSRPALEAWPPNVTTRRPLLPASRSVLRMNGARMEARG